jgi:NHLM bacteriocin system ABC transporter ATP-binding protein
VEPGDEWLGQAVELWRTRLGTTPDGGERSEADRVEARAVHDRRLEDESEQELVAVFHGRRLADLPAGLPAVAAVLVVAARAAGATVQPSRIRSLAVADPERMSVAELAARLRVPARRVKLEGRWWLQSGLPRLAFLGGEPVALLPRRRRYVVRDAAGHRFALKASTAAALDPSAYTIYPRLPSEAVGARDLVRLALLDTRWDLMTLTALTVMLAAISAVFPYATAQIVGTVIPSGARETLTYLLVALAVFTIVQLMASVGQALVLLGLSSRAAARLTAAVWDRLLHVPASFLRGRSAGQLAVEVTAFDQMRTLIGTSLATALVGSALVLGGLGVLVSISAGVAVVELLLIALSVACGWWILSRYGHWLERAIQDRNRLNGLLLGLFSGIATLRVNGAERRGHALWAHGYALQQRAQRQAGLERVRLTMLQMTLPGLLLLGAIAALGTLDLKTIGLAGFAAAVAASGQVAIGAAAVIIVASSLAQLRPLYHSARAILEAPPASSENVAVPGIVRGEFEFTRVTFGYTVGRPILRDVSFSIPAGAFVAVVGPSGAGKSTLLRLMLGFDVPWEGEVMLDGRSLNGLDLEAVRRQMGTVIQGARVTAGSLLTNIVGSLPIGADEAWKAAELAGVAPDIRAMPMGMATVVPEGGTGFSGGQLQRILLARALVRRPRILLLDEATSQLDNTTQRIVTDNLAELGVTRVVVAHRLTTIRHADHIVVLDKGCVVEQGQHDELVAANGLFARLAHRQTL